MARLCGQRYIQMRATRAVQPRLTIPEFVELYAPLPGKYELWGGVPLLRAAGTARHALVGGNIIASLRAKLRGTGCAPFNSDLMLRVCAENGRLPDVAIYYDPRDIADPSALAFERPSVVFEILSPSTARVDRGAKLTEYQAIESVHTIVFVDPDLERMETWDRVAANEWRDVQHPAGADLALTHSAVILTAAEIFAPV